MWKCKEYNTFALVRVEKCKEYNTLAAHAAESPPYGSRDVETQRVQHFRPGVFEKGKEYSTLAAHAAQGPPFVLVMWKCIEYNTFAVVRLRNAKSTTHWLPTRPGIPQRFS